MSWTSRNLWIFLRRVVRRPWREVACVVVRFFLPASTCRTCLDAFISETLEGMNVINLLGFLNLQPSQYKTSGANLGGRSIPHSCTFVFLVRQLLFDLSESDTYIKLVRIRLKGLGKSTYRLRELHTGLACCDPLSTLAP